MDIWLGRCNKTVGCTYCKEYVTVGEPQVFGKLWMRKSGEELVVRRYVLNFRWHARRKRDGQCCWLAQGIEHFEQTPYVEKRGRRAMELGKDEKKRRLQLLRMHAHMAERLDELSQCNMNDLDVDELVKIGVRLIDIKEEIEKIGGVPKSWK